MKSIVIDTVNMPTWALSVLVNDDFSGVPDEDEALIREWRLTYAPDVIFQTPDIIQPFFCKNPAFGLPCDCVTVDICLIRDILKPGSYIGNSAWGFFSNAKEVISVARKYGYMGEDISEDDNIDEIVWKTDEAQEWLKMFLPQNHYFAYIDGELWIVHEDEEIC